MMTKKLVLLLALAMIVIGCQNKGSNQILSENDYAHLHVYKSEMEQLTKAAVGDLSWQISQYESLSNLPKESDPFLQSLFQIEIARIELNENIDAHIFHLSNLAELDSNSYTWKNPLDLSANQHYWSTDDHATKLNNQFISYHKLLDSLFYKITKTNSVQPSAKVPQDIRDNASISISVPFKSSSWAEVHLQNQGLLSAMGYLNFLKYLSCRAEQDFFILYNLYIQEQ